jgi:two-component system phosphate regulon sensor histidine kinase PhoR
VKTLKLLHLLIIGSSIVALLLVGLLFGLNADPKGFSSFDIIIAVLLCFACTYFVFSFLIKRFIDDRLKILYRSIRKGKMTGSTEKSFRLSDDIITEVEEQTKSWTLEKNLEISKLKEQEQFRREFLGNLGHELKTPVFAIQGYILTLLDGGLEDEKVNTLFLERAAKATDRMANILTDLDQITKLEVDELKLDFKNFDIVDLMQDIMDSLQINAKEKEITIDFSMEYSNTFVFADRGKIAQVLTNLINNSINYGKPKGKTILRLFIMDDIVTVEVSDNGPGIAEDQIPRLFERFYRIEKSRNRHEGGSGLGLAIVKHIIESHHQVINVRSTVDVGSTFAFTLKKGKQISKPDISSRGL